MGGPAPGSSVEGQEGAGLNGIGFCRPRMQTKIGATGTI